jgi:hypothetical protein
VTTANLTKTEVDRTIHTGIQIEQFGVAVKKKRERERERD